MAFWNRSPKKDGSDYMKFVHRYMDQVERIEAEAIERFNKSDENTRVDDLVQNLLKIIEDMGALPIPQDNDDLFQKNKQSHLWILKSLLRKLEDIRDTGGSNLERIVAEDQEVMEQFEQEALAAQEEDREMNRRLGLG